MKRSAAIVLFTLPLAACVMGSQTFYVGPQTASFWDFADAQYTCVKQTTSTQYSAGIGQYGGYAESTVAPVCSLYWSCMRAAGYERTTVPRDQAGALPANYFDPGEITCQR